MSFSTFQNSSKSPHSVDKQWNGRIITRYLPTSRWRLFWFHLKPFGEGRKTEVPIEISKQRRGSHETKKRLAGVLFQLKCPATWQGLPASKLCDQWRCSNFLDSHYVKLCTQQEP